MSYNDLPFHNPRCIINWKRQIETEEMSKNPRIKYRLLVLQDIHKEKSERHISMAPSKEKLEGRHKKSVRKRTYIPKNPQENELEILGCSTEQFGSLPSSKKKQYDKKQPEKPTSSFLSYGHKHQKMTDVTGPGTYDPHSYEESENIRRHIPDLYKMSKRSELFVSTTNLGPGSYETKSFVEILADKTNAHRGRFLTSERFPSKPGERIYWESARTLPLDVNNQVAPNSYAMNPLHQRSVVRGRKKAAFLSSAPRTPCDNLLGPMNFTGPGRYVLQGSNYSPHAPAATYVFNSKSSRHLSLTQMAHWETRIRPRGIPKFPTVRRIDII